MTHSDKNVVTNSSFEKIYKTNKNKLDNSQKILYAGNKLKSWKRTDNKRTLTES